MPSSSSPDVDDRFFDVSAFAYAHRGLWGDRVPENSAAAFRSARSNGIGVELDVRLTADGAPVVFHDATLERMCGDRASVAGLSSKDLQGIFLPDGFPIPTLSEALDIMDGLPVLIELKVDDADGIMADVVATALRDRSGPCAVMSFDVPTVAKLCRLVQDRPVGLLVDAEARIGVDAVRTRAAQARAIGCDYLAPHLTSLGTASSIAGGLPLVTWTLRAPSDLGLARKYAAAPIFEGFSPLQASGLAKPRGTPI